MDGRVTAGSPQHAGALRLTGLLQGPVWALATAALPDGTFVVAAGGSKGRVTWWNGASGELLSEAVTADQVVVRSMIAATLPDGRVRFATASSRGTVQLWDGVQGVQVGRAMSSDGGPVWSMAALTVPGPRA
ncbi:MAG TPA: WD40 repeat domain-containing protein, partial [Streptosporangiaceae bacterium]|nr:WD40 repeat domain-containing protein [Streptosporangiaceae bacterium]